MEEVGKEEEEEIYQDLLQQGEEIGEEIEGRPEGYDNEWVRFLDRLNQDSSLGTLVEYISSVRLTDRAKDKLISYITVLLDKEFATSRLSDGLDYMRLLDDKSLIDADLALGLTKFDITPEFQHIINLVRIKFGIKIRKSVGGFERRIIATQRRETVSEAKISREGEKRTSTSKIGGFFR